MDQVVTGGRCDTRFLKIAVNNLEFVNKYRYARIFAETCIVLGWQDRLVKRHINSDPSVKQKGESSEP